MQPVCYIAHALNLHSIQYLNSLSVQVHIYDICVPTVYSFTNGYTKVLRRIVSFRKMGWSELTNKIKARVLNNKLTFRKLISGPIELWWLPDILITEWPLFTDWFGICFWCLYNKAFELAIYMGLSDNPIQCTPNFPVI